MYAVWLPTPKRILKVGFSRRTSGSRIAGGYHAAEARKRRGWDATGSSCIWQQPGDTRAEAWMQATALVPLAAPFHAGDGRLCEWFTVYHLTVEEIIKVVDSTYRLVPPDLTRPASELRTRRRLIARYARGAGERASPRPLAYASPRPACIVVPTHARAFASCHRNDAHPAPSCALHPGRREEVMLGYG